MKNDYVSLFGLILISYLLGYFLYIPLYVCLIATFVLQIFIWKYIAKLTVKINNKKTDKLVGVLAFYKLALSVLGYGLVDLPDFLPFGIVFSELSKSLLATFVVTQIRPFGFRLHLHIFDDNIVLLLQVIISVIFSLGIIISYYYFKKHSNDKKINGESID